MKLKQEYTLQKALIYTMLAVYVFGLIKPVIPIISDVLAHTFFKTSHVATVHYENGKHHIHLELKEEAKHTNTKQPSTFSDTDFLFTHIQSDAVPLIIVFEAITSSHLPYLCSEIIKTAYPPFIPPKV